MYALAIFYLFIAENSPYFGTVCGRYVDKSTKKQPDHQSSASSAISFDELTAKGVVCNIDEIEKDIIDRDYRDMHRETSPLKQADDAILLDSSELDIDGVVAAMKKIIEEA